MKLETFIIGVAAEVLLFLQEWGLFLAFIIFAALFTVAVKKAKIWRKERRMHRSLCNLLKMEINGGVEK